MSGASARLNRCEPGKAVGWVSAAQWRIWDSQARDWVQLRGRMDRETVNRYAARNPQRYWVFMVKTTTRATRASGDEAAPRP